jgi:putative nucleotidyltransferase with HDIG domain
VFSAYLYGRRHATLTALASVLVVVLLVYVNPFILQEATAVPFLSEQWLDIVVWGGTLIVTAYMMGSLYEHKDVQLRELRETYHGILMILRHFISKDKYTENHSYRVSVYATKIAAQLELDSERIEDIRAAALLHDIGKLDISRQILYKAARLTESEFAEMQKHVEKGIAMLEPVGGSLRRILPIILSHHDKFDGSGYHPTHGEDIPLEARIISVADVYDSLTSDRPYRKAMSPFEVREILTKGAGTEFDPKVVEAFLTAFRKGEMEVPTLVI